MEVNDDKESSAEGTAVKENSVAEEEAKEENNDELGTEVNTT